VIGHLEKTVIDCPDPRALAQFYCQVLGMKVNEDIDGWVVIGARPGLRQLAFQRVDEWVPPRWPDPAHPQQLHLDIRVSDADQAEQELLALGATRSRGQRETGFRVFTDPVGHPFCIVFGQHNTAAEPSTARPGGQLPPAPSAPARSAHRHPRTPQPGTGRDPLR
jgi:catechol 2,3-dioxygenase-like lactoylglutathione lyase family enzyme